MSCGSSILIAAAFILIGSVTPLHAAAPLRSEYSFHNIQTKPVITRGSLDALMKIETRDGMVVPIPDFDLIDC